MRLTEKELSAITVGSVKTVYEDGGYHFFKYTDKQLAFYDGEDRNGLGARARTTTGVRLDFHTSSSSLTFEVLKEGKYELYIDGLLAKDFFPAERERFTCALGAEGEENKERRVTLILPSHGVGILSFVELEDGASLRPHTFDKKILFIGDSITQGWDSGYDSMSFAYRLSFLENAESVIQGTGGAYFHEDSFAPLPFSPDEVFVALGTNDFGHYQTIEEMASHADAHLKKIAEEYAGKPLYYISPIWRASQQRSMGSFADARAALIGAAEKNGFRHIDGFTLVPHHPAFYLDDLLHPNALGYAQYAEHLFALLHA